MAPPLGKTRDRRGWGPARGRGVALALLLGLAGVSAGQVASARPAETASTGAPSDAGRCSQRERSALAELGCEIARELGALGVTSVSAAPPVSDRPITTPDRLATRLIRSVVAALGPDATALTPAPSLPEARRGAKGAATIVYLSLTIAGGEVRVTADAQPMALGFWDRLRGRTASAARHAFASRRLDGEIAAFLPVVPLVATRAGERVERATHTTSDVVAAACGDVDGDASLELSLVGRRRIQLGRVRAHAFVPTAEAAWSTLAPVAPSPLREPLASASVHTGRGLLVGSSDRSATVSLSPSLTRQAELGSGLPVPGVGCVERTGTSLGGVTPCGDETPPRTAILRADAVAGGLAVGRDGVARRVTAQRAASDGVVSLADDAGRAATATGLGGALAVADLDRDGVPELIASTDARSPEADALVVQSWDPGGALIGRYRLPVPEGIRALAVCPPEDAGVSTIVVVTPAHVWLVR